MVDEEHVTKGKIFDLSERLYNEFTQYKVISDEYRIPKQIHFIWLGSPLPERCKLMIESWRRFHPDWTITLWTDDEVESFNLFNIKEFRKAKNYGQKSDIWRYEILNRYGGVYVDIDFECLQSFDTLHRSCEFYTGISRCGAVILNGLIGSRANHPILEACIRSLKTTLRQADYTKIMEETGPYFFTKIIKRRALNSPKGTIAIFPPSFFYSFPAIYRSNFSGDVMQQFVTSDSMAVHYWSNSWQKKS